MELTLIQSEEEQSRKIGLPTKTNFTCNDPQEKLLSDCVMDKMNEITQIHVGRSVFLS